MMKYICRIVSAVTVAAFASCSGNGESAGEHDVEADGHGDGESSEVELSDAQMKTVGITLGRPVMREIGSAVKASGELAVSPQDVAEVSPMMPGIVKMICVKEGDHVGSGRAVAYVENMEIIAMQENYLSSLEQLQLARKEYDRQTALSDEGAGIARNLEQARTAFLVAENQAEGVKQQLRQAEINPDNVSKGKITALMPLSSPISGNVSKINIKTGGYADMQTPIMTITDNSAVYCMLNVFEKDLRSVSVGQKVNMRLTNRPDESILGRIEEINESINPSTRTVAVRVAVDKDSIGSATLIPGMAVSALIHTGSVESMTLPEDAVVKSGGRSYVFVLEDSHKEQDGTVGYHFAKREVVTGPSELGYIEVRFLKPLGDDSQVVTSNAFYLGSMSADHGEHSH